MSDDYRDSGEFHDLFMEGPWRRLRPVLAATFGGLPPEALLVDIGAGTGLGTRALASCTAARLFALEPSLTQRAVLIARVADDEDLCRRVTVSAEAVPGALDGIDSPLAGFVCAHVLGHLAPPTRRATFAALATRLAPAGVGLITLPAATTLPATTTGPDSDVEESRTIGEYRYVARYLAGAERGRSVSEYEVHHGTRMLRRERVTSTWDPPTADLLHEELAAAGLTLEPADPGVGLVRRVR